MTTGVMSVVSATQARETVDFQLVGRDCDQIVRECALLRSCLWALSGGDRPVHVLRVLNLAFDLSPENIFAGRDSVALTGLRSRLRAALDNLSDAGDILSLANGRWLPAPLRQVPLGMADGARLLVGGFPSSLLPETLRKTISHRGAFRRVNSEELGRKLGLPEERLESWVGSAPENLMSWTKFAMDGSYEPFSEANDGSRFAFYAPKLARPGALQTKRWLASAEKLSGRYLGRRELPFGMRQYRAIEVIGGRVVSVSLPRLGNGDLRRLMYGLDALAANPVRVETALTSNEFVVVLGSEIPRQERRFFAALGTLSVPIDKYYPRTWRFPVVYIAEVKKRLLELDVQFVASDK